MSDEDFRKLCNTFGFAPSRALRELIDCVRAQEIEACAKAVEAEAHMFETLAAAKSLAAAIRARKEKT